MKFQTIDQQNWPRKKYFEHYLNQQTSFSMASEIEIDFLLKNLQKRRYKFYPAFIYMVMKTVNMNVAFRTCFNSQGELGYWDKMHPSYTIFDDASETFSSIWTELPLLFRSFHDRYKEDLTQYNGTRTLFPKTPIPENTIPISMIPWYSFTSFHLNINNGGQYLLPIITAGKFFKRGHKTFLPVSLQLHHAVCDGYHAGLFMNHFQKLVDQCEEWL